MENMLPENSFPQICVVSVNKFVEIAYLTQEYRRSASIGNVFCLLIINWPGEGREHAMRLLRSGRKKEEFPGIMENMLPGNSFPQICVVSRDQFVEIALRIQEHRRSVTESNCRVY
jgi:hypothetical protein